ncbi:MAG: NUDIX domain-containing protein [Desulfobacteraceae bacterium]|nr:NUDIX domain-containing protein [Desulfobacteraceae bacterium]
MVEYLDVVDSDDRVVGVASREEVHGRPHLIHRIARVLVFNSAGDLFLQKRSENKDVQPGKWDTSVGGHVDRGESYDAAAYRETQEELGIHPRKLTFLYKHLYQDGYESEYVQSYAFTWDSEFHLNTDEIQDGRFWQLDDITTAVDPSRFTPQLLDELKHYYKHLRSA